MIQAHAQENTSSISAVFDRHSVAAGAITGVVGDPVEHSKSPLIHNYWITAHNARSIYAPFQISNDNIKQFLEEAPRYGVKGLNVTTPHKQAAFDICDTVSERARRVEAVNTIVYDRDGRAHGDSTDGWGFVESMKAGADWAPAKTRALIIGAGGAAGAIVDALAAAGAARITLCNRTAARAEAIAARYDARVVLGPWPCSPAEVAEADLLVNATTLGMLDGDDAGVWRAIFDGVRLGPGVVATDLIYAPLQTPFLIAAAAAGAATVDGLGMLLHQARPGFALWHGVTPVVSDALRALVLAKSGYLP